MISIHYGYILFFNRQHLLSQKTCESSSLPFLFLTSCGDIAPNLVLRIFCSQERLIGACVCLCGGFERGCAR